MIFVLFHGAFGSAEGNWFPILKAQLESVGQTVIVPQFPVDKFSDLVEGEIEPTKQTLENWYSAFDPLINSLPKDTPICFVGHSLGCIFALRVVEKYKIQLDSAIFVGAFLDCLPEEVWPYTKIIPSFQKTDFDPIEMKKLIPTSYHLYSDTDPYVPNRQSINFAKAVDGNLIPLKSAGHMNKEVSLDEFNLVLDLCLTRLDLDYAQKYQYIKKKVGAFEFVQGNPEGGQIALESEESINFKIFRFQNIKDSGYATLYTGLKKLQMAHSSYMEYARQAAARMKIFERAIILSRLEDLKDEDTLEQIRADIQSGINISLCLYDSIKTKVPEPDFGIWDDRYVVINKFDPKTTEPTETIVSSNKIEISRIKKWWKIVKAHSYAVNSIEDVKQYLKINQ